MKTKKLLSYLLTITTLISTILPSFAMYKDSIADEEYHDIEVSSETNNTTVYAEVGSSFKVIIPKHIILDGTTKSGAYTVSVECDIAGDESIWVIPDEYFRLNSVNKLDIYAYINQDKISWTYDDINTIANGFIETENMTAGSWNGNFNFNIQLETSTAIYAVATTYSNEISEIEAVNVSGEQKHILTDALIQSNLVEENSSYDLLIKIKDVDKETNKIDFNVSNVSEPGDSALILQEEDGNWAYVYEKMTSNNRTISIDYQKIPVIEGNHIHTYTEEVEVNPTCTEDGTLLYKCTGEDCNLSVPFSIPATHKLEVIEKKDENGELINKYYECTNCTYSILNLTKLFAGEELSHNCNDYLITKYDTTQHWNECSVPGCNKTFNKINHVLKTTDYNYGYKSCYPSNTRTTYCTSCGYSKTFSDAHTGLSSWKKEMPRYMHYKNCSGCNGWVTTGSCVKSDGSIITCTNLGTCNICKASYTSSNTNHYISDYDGKCEICSTQVISQIEPVEITYSSDRKYAYITYTLKGKNFSGTPSLPSSPWNNGSIKGSSVKILKNTSTEFSFRYTITQNSSIVKPYSVAPAFYMTINGKSTYVYINSGYTKVIYEASAPTINEPEQNSITSSNDWSLQKQLTFSGTENHCDIVYLTLLDNDGNVYFENDTAHVSSKAWKYTCIPDIEAPIEGKEFILKVTDTLGNTSSKTFTVSKTDKKSPIPSLNSTTSTEWSKTKEVLFSATDEGSGDVQIAFNNINEYVDMTKNDTLYTKKYQFSGDVYGEILAAIYYKDAVGNVATQFIKVHNLDNTVPTILNVDRNENILTISANDLNKELQMEGSGISGFAITWTSAPPQESDWQESNTFEITKGGTYYLWVRDAVGNVSDSYEIKILL